MANETTTFRPRNAALELLPVREATPIAFEGFAEFDFLLYKMDGLYAIAEVSTGLPIVRGMDSKFHARDKATVVLTKHGVEATRKVIALQRERITDREVA